MTTDSMTTGSGPIDEWLDAHESELIALRRHLHANPELSGQEYATTRLVSERLSAAGADHRVLASGTGLICDLGDVSRGTPARLALRADIDALGMDDLKDVAYRSQVAGACHACGHDVHTVVALGAALYYAQHSASLPGPVRFIFQPAEERMPGGALDVLVDGGLDGVDAIVGLHCAPKLDVGTIGLRTGSITSATDVATIVLRGPGGHTARPEETVDMVTVAARLALELPAAIDELIGGPPRVRFVFGAIHGGDAANVIPTSCELRASVRTPDLGVWELLPSAVEKAIGAVLAGSGAAFELTYVSGVPPVVNDAAVMECVRRAVTGAFGADAVIDAEQSWGGDDFAWYTRERPGAYLRLGVHDPAIEHRHDLHVGRFDVDERSIATGVRLLVAVIESYFDQMLDDVAIV